jgi:hypothetical protein
VRLLRAQLASRRPGLEEVVEREWPKCVSSPVADDVDILPANTCKAPPPAVGTRRCDGCGADFRPARPWWRFCCPTCRLRAHRRLAGDTRAQKLAAIYDGDTRAKLTTYLVPTRARARLRPDAAIASSSVLVIRGTLFSWRIAGHHRWAWKAFTVRAWVNSLRHARIGCLGKLRPAGR